MLNKGISFGLFSSIPVWVIALVLICLVVYAVLPAQVGKVRELWGRVGVILIVFGGVGNLVSRVIYGGVRDYWNFFGLFYNNIWDYLITLGLIIYGYTYFVRR